MRSTLCDLIERLDTFAHAHPNVISWGSPVAAFGNPTTSTIASLGLNPSNKEFVDDAGYELDGSSRRFHTLRSLGISRWSKADEAHVDLIGASCEMYFSRNPYNGWFKRLDQILGGAQASFYDRADPLFGSNLNGACHLDLIPYATKCKWTDLTRTEQSDLMAFSGDALGQVLKSSSIRVLILNGQTVVDTFEKITNVELDREEHSDWMLPRRDGFGVRGFGYTGSINEIYGLELGREISVFGYNHNIQSSFGVTLGVIDSIKEWISRQVHCDHETEG